MGVYFFHRKITSSILRDWKNCWLKTFHMCGGRCSQALPPPAQPQSQCPSLAVAANPWHSPDNAPHPPLEPPTQLLRGQVTRSPTWGKGPERPRVFKAENECSMSQSYLPFGIPVSWTPLETAVVAIYTCFFLSFFFFYCPFLWRWFKILWAWNLWGWKG